ncbi:acyltransferase [Streptomyces sp. NPDC048518]|uniref:acyltransferase n=1 Tax=Streptomyces sp. NPDC048518 TaxID=3155029 RepID=UPI0033F64A22
MMSTEELLRLTVSALMSRTGERQGDLAAGLGQAQSHVSRKQTGRQHWTLDDVDRLAAHYGMPVLDLLAGPTHAAGKLAADRLTRGAQTLIPLAQPPAPPRTALPAAPAAEAAPEAVSEAPASVHGEGERPCVLCGHPAREEVDGYPQHLDPAECATAATEAANSSSAEASPTEPAADPASAPVQSPAPPPPAPAAAPRRAPGYASGSLVEQITDRVREASTEHEGDFDAALDALIKSAIPDVMTLFKSSRVGGRYEHSEFPPTQEILRKKSQKGADDIWEGRPKWSNKDLKAAAKKGDPIEVFRLDMNAAYLSALKCWLPIGRLQEDTSGVHNPRKSGVHLITPPVWDHSDLPNPLGSRQEPGDLWVTESTLRLLLDCARQDLAEAPVIRRSLVSGATESLLEKLRRALAEVRKNALSEGDDLTVEYVKAMYSKFVSTIGESSANRELRRPDWMHIIRAKAFSNLWMKASKARASGLTVVEISGTDELHVMGDWRSVFPEGRDLNQVKQKGVYTIGGSR